MRRNELALGLVIAASATGCAGTEQRNLIITEVGKKQVELYLDEGANRGMSFGNGYKLSVRTATGHQNSINLSTAPSLGGGDFMLIWEKSGYRGPPMAEPFPSGQQGSVPGIAVRNNFFGDIDAEGSEIRIRGTHNRVSNLIVIFPIFTTDEIDDVVRFGDPTNRPQTGGTFQATGTLPNPSGSISISRLWSGSAPRDTDSETDWNNVANSWGVPTP